jgi:acylphosphatase
LIAGRVQGVWYRVSAKNEATRLSLCGWALNLADGRVEVVVAGGMQAVAEFCGWLWEGPPAARVESVTIEEYGQEVQPGFDVR